MPSFFKDIYYYSCPIHDTSMTTILTMAYMAVDQLSLPPLSVCLRRLVTLFAYLLHKFIFGATAIAAENSIGSGSIRKQVSSTACFRFPSHHPSPSGTRLSQDQNRSSRRRSTLPERTALQRRDNHDCCCYLHKQTQRPAATSYNVRSKSPVRGTLPLWASLRLIECSTAVD